MKFSVIIPVYNVAPYLRECLDSVLAQTCPDWEAICVDDGSTDGSGAILDDYAAKDARLRVIHQPNAGVSAARNVALERVSGEWILFLDGDDVYAPDTLSSLRGMIAESPCDIVFFNSCHFEDGKAIDWPSAGEKTVLREMPEELPIIRNHSCLSGGQAYRRGLVRTLRQGRFAYGEDFLYLAQAMALSKRVLLTGRFFYGYRTRQGQATSLCQERQEKCLLDLIATRTQALRAIAKSGKRVDAYSARWIGHELTEDAYRMSNRLSAESRGRVRRAIREDLMACARLPVGLRAFDRLRMRVLARRVSLAWLLCGLPAAVRQGYGRVRLWKN